MNNPAISIGKEALLAAGINKSVPIAEMIKPIANPFRYPKEFNMSFFRTAEITKYKMEPTVYAT